MAERERRLQVRLQATRQPTRHAMALMLLIATVLVWVTLDVRPLESAAEKSYQDLVSANVLRRLAEKQRLRSERQEVGEFLRESHRYLPWPRH